MRIKQNKAQTFLYSIIVFLAFLLLVSFCVFDYRELSHKPSILLDNAVFFWAFRLLCALSSVILLFSYIYFIKQLFSKSYLIEITQDALIDHSSAISVGEIRWNDIKRVYIKNTFLVIELKDPTIYLDRLGVVARLLAKGNKKMGYDYICISTQRFKKQGFEFLSALNKNIHVAGFQDIISDEE